MREPDLLTKNLLLDLSWREIVVVVEADLADCPRKRLRIQCATDLARSLFRIGRELPCCVWMDANGKSDVTPPRTDLIRLLQLGFVVGREDDEGTADTRLSCA